MLFYIEIQELASFTAVDIKIFFNFIPPIINRRMSISQLQQQNKFKKHLAQYWASKGITQIKIPQIGGQQLNLYKLYKTVCKKGGGQSVSHNKLWKEIVDQFGLPSTCTSASFTLKNHYQKYLLGYEQRFFFGKDDTSDLPELVAGRQRKPIIKGEGYGGLLSSRFQLRSQSDLMHSSLAAELKKYYEKADQTQGVTFLKRTKLYPVMPQVKHLIMAFQSNLRQEVVYAINTLLLFSVNTEAPFLFSQYPFVLDAIHSYFQKNYPANDLFTLECVRTLTAALRNLLMNHKNLHAVLDSDLMEDFFRVFQSKGDKQISRNVIDILSSLTRVGLDLEELFGVIEQYLQKQTYEDIQTGLDLLRSLVEQKEDLCQKIVSKKIDYFARLLVYSSAEIRQSILQIFAYLTDKTQSIKAVCINSFKFMDRLFATLSHGFGSTQKQAQLSCFILNNIFQIGTPQSYAIFRKYQRILVLVSFNDENLSPIISSILFALSGRKSDLMLDERQEENAAVVNMRMNIRNQLGSNSSPQDSDQ